MIYALSVENTQTIGQRTVEALTNLVLGMVVVFAVLTILFVIISLVGKIFVAQEKKKEKSNAVKPASSPVEEISQDESNTESSNEEIVAAITAALNIYLECEGVAPGSFRVVSFRKTNAKPSWNKK